MISHFKNFFLFLLLVIFSVNSAFAFVTNSGGDFTVSFDSQKEVVVNTNMETTFSIVVENNLDISQDIRFNFDEVSGWDNVMENSEFRLSPQESKSVEFTLRANSNFDYSQNVVSSDTIKIGRKDDYRGFFEFPVSIESSQDEVSLVFQIEVIPEDDLNTVYISRISSQEISPVSPLGFTVEADQISSEHNVSIFAELGDYEFDEIQTSFSGDSTYKIFSIPINSSVEPGSYTTQITVREENLGDSAQEWYTSKTIEVVEYSDVEVVESSRTSIFHDVVVLELKNNGNVEDVFSKEINYSFIQGLFFTSNVETQDTSSGSVIEIILNKGESKTVEYGYNYISLYVLLFVLFVLIGYVYYRKTSNPFDVETKVYEVKRDKHEGLKSLKIRIGFENIKADRIDTLKVIFRMPAYLKIQEESFLLTPPNQVLKGKSQYRLEWNFKNFEKNDSRILGFAMVNSKGILGDIHFKDLEFEVKIDGKVKKFYSSLPVVKG